MLQAKVKETRELLSQLDFEKLWEGFHAFPFAFYNSENVYVSENLEASLELEELAYGVYKGKADERFAGNTAISLDGQLAAIWNEAGTTELAPRQLAAYLAHEMFHAHQYSYGEKRFPNELLGIDYPFTVENLHLRIVERDYLLKACLAETEEEQLVNLSCFFECRRERQKLIGAAIDFEKAVETIEGTAVYIEFNAYRQLHDVPVSVEDYMGDYGSVTKEFLQIRRSTYGQGLLLALIADAMVPHWKRAFMNSSDFLSDMLETELVNRLQRVPLDFIRLDAVFAGEKKELEAQLAEREVELLKVFEEFERNPRSNLIEEGVKVTGIDPMNIVKRGDWVIHQNFLRINREAGDEMLRGPVRVKIGKNLFDVERIEW